MLYTIIYNYSYVTYMNIFDPITSEISCNNIHGQYSGHLLVTDFAV